jgi:hypothetical protein
MMNKEVERGRRDLNDDIYYIYVDTKLDDY